MIRPLRTHRQPRRAALLSSLCVVLLAAALSAATKKPPPHPVNLNSAGSEELQQVPGIGPATADKILQMRKSYGAFKSVDDLLAVRGIGKKRLDKMRKYLTAGKPVSAPPRKPAAANSAPPMNCADCAKVAPPVKQAALPLQPKVPVKKNAADPAAPVPDNEEEEPESR